MISNNRRRQGGQECLEKSWNFERTLRHATNNAVHEEGRSCRESRRARIAIYRGCIANAPIQNLSSSTDQISGHHPGPDSKSPQIQHKQVSRSGRPRVRADQCERTRWYYIIRKYTVPFRVRLVIEAMAAVVVRFTGKMLQWKHSSKLKSDILHHH